MADDGKEGFLARWARLKRRTAPESPAASPAPPADTPAPALPPVDELDFDSDFRDFMHRKVDEAVRRAALKKLFGDPRFNVSDGLDVYAEDYAALQPLAGEVVARLRDAYRAAGGAQAEREAAPAPSDAPGEPPAAVQDAAAAGAPPPPPAAAEGDREERDG